MSIAFVTPAECSDCGDGQDGRQCAECFHKDVIAERKLEERTHDYDE